MFSKKFHVQTTIIATSFRSEHVAITIKELEPIGGGVELAIVFCILPLHT